METQEEQPKIVELTSKNFDDVIKKATTPVLVDFYTPWCGPCKMITPMLEEVAGELEGKITFGKVNADEEIEIKTRFKIGTYPTILIFKDGEVADQIVGLAGKYDLMSRLDIK